MADSTFQVLSPLRTSIIAVHRSFTALSHGLAKKASAVRLKSHPLSFMTARGRPAPLELKLEQLRS